MSVTGPATTLQAILNQIQAPAPAGRAGAARGTAPATPTPAVGAANAATRPVAQAQVGNITQNGAASFNPNAPRGTYLNIVV
jgi:hypothetical protein